MEIKNVIELRKVLGVEGALEEFVCDSLLSTNNFRITDMSYEELVEFLEYGVDVDFYHLVPFSNSVTDCEIFLADYMQEILDTLNYYIDNDPNKGPIVRWRSHANLLYSNWLNYFVYQETPYDIRNIR